ncbi:MAG: hypothetical protein JKX85_04590 [Phycisphaeraceae bacterium]|nr:hypothetical protein [Phycisphaeraceae bacterium]
MLVSIDPKPNLLAALSTRSIEAPVSFPSRKNIIFVVPSYNFKVKRYMVLCYSTIMSSIDEDFYIMAHYDNSSKKSGKDKMPKRNKRVDDYNNSKKKKSNGYYRPADS